MESSSVKRSRDSDPTTSSPNNGDGERTAILNKSFVTWLQQQSNLNPCSSWSAGVQDYLKYARWGASQSSPPQKSAKLSDDGNIRNRSNSNGNSSSMPITAPPLKPAVTVATVAASAATKPSTNLSESNASTKAAVPDAKPTLTSVASSSSSMFAPAKPITSSSVVTTSATATTTATGNKAGGLFSSIPNSSSEPNTTAAAAAIKTSGGLFSNASNTSSLTSLSSLPSSSSVIAANKPSFGGPFSSVPTSAAITAATTTNPVTSTIATTSANPIALTAALTNANKPLLSVAPVIAKTATVDAATAKPSLYGTLANFGNIAKPSSLTPASSTTAATATGAPSLFGGATSLFSSSKPPAIPIGGITGFGPFGSSTGGSTVATPSIFGSTGSGMFPPASSFASTKTGSGSGPSSLASSPRASGGEDGDGGDGDGEGEPQEATIQATKAFKGDNSETIYEVPLAKLLKRIDIYEIDPKLNLNPDRDAQGGGQSDNSPMNLSGDAKKIAEMKEKGQLKNYEDLYVNSGRKEWVTTVEKGIFKILRNPGSSKYQLVMRDITSGKLFMNTYMHRDMKFDKIVQPGKKAPDGSVQNAFYIRFPASVLDILDSKEGAIYKDEGLNRINSQRLTMFMVRVKEEEIDSFHNKLEELKKLC